MSAAPQSLTGAEPVVEKPEHRLAVRLAFLVAGFGVAC